MKTWKERALPFLERALPVARVAERIASLAVQMEKPTLVGVAGMAAAGISGLAEHLGGPRSPGWQVEVYASKGQVLQAIQEAGAKVAVQRYQDGSESVDCRHGGVRFFVLPNGALTIAAAPSHEFVEWLRQALDRVLLDAVEVKRKPTMRDMGAGFEASATQLSQHHNAQAAAIMGATLPLIEGGRCILLDGKPGVGKTTLAQIIARDAKLGRTVLLEGGIVGGGASEFSAVSNQSLSGSDVREALSLLSPGVVIVDDVDKIHLGIARLEALRSAARLVILTANNGAYDQVLDGSLTRAGRVDEVFTIVSTELRRDAPFNLLPDDVWLEVSQWPIAYQNEVRKRLSGRPGDLRLEDLRARLAKKTRSGDMLL